MKTWCCILLIIICCISTTSALAGYDYCQEITYTACDQAIYQQDIVIHRNIGTAYEEVSGSLNIWHIYVDEHCQEDYDDVRFTDISGAELPYYLWPDYTNDTAEFCVQVVNTTDGIICWYGNIEARTTSDENTVLYDVIANPSFETTGSWSYSESDGPGGCAGTIPSGGWSSDGSKSVYIYVGFHSMYTSSYYGQYTQSITVPAGQYMLIFDCYGSQITSGYGYMSMRVDGVEKYHKTSQGVQLSQQSGSFLSTGTSIPIILRNGISSGGITRYGSGYWDNLIVHTYSSTPPAALEFSGELAISDDVRSFPGYNRKPTDPDGDGLYEDVNGNGRLDFQDIMIFFQYNAWAKANQPKVECWDWSGNGAIEFSDVQAFWEAEFT